MMRKGVLVGLGTDGYTNDMLESMKAANCLHKHHLEDPAAAWAEVPQMLLCGNAAMAARFFQTPLGELRPGAAADIIALDYDPLTPMDAGNLHGHMLFGMSGRDVTATVVNGVLRMKDRQIVGVDLAALYAQCREQAAKFWNRINA
jgi:cytosine/adenosine deaminase-related metal-dependent hydrolase